MKEVRFDKKAGKKVYVIQIAHDYRFGGKYDCIVAWWLGYSATDAGDIYDY